jgi:MFS family permease
VGVVSLPRSLLALEERPFRLLWLGQTSSALGDSLIAVALAFAVLELTNSAAKLGLVLAVFFVFRVGLMLVGGVWADRLPRRSVMIGCDWIRAVAQASAAFALITDTAELWMLLLLAAVMGASSAFFGPASTGLVPETVSPARLQQANALIGISKSTTNIFGPVLSGVLVATFGPGWVFAIDASSFVVSAVFVTSMRLPATRVAPRQRFVEDLAVGWKEVVSRSWLWISFASFALQNGAVASFFVLGPAIARDELGGATDWGLILAGGAAGGLLGSVLALRVRPRRPLRWVFLVVTPASLQLVFLVPPLGVVAVAAAAGAAMAGIALSNVVWHTTLQGHVPAHVLSRVSSYDWMVSLVFMPVGFALSGPIAEAVGVEATLWGAAAIFVAANIAPLAVPSVRNLRSPSVEPPSHVEPPEAEPLGAPAVGLGQISPLAEAGPK